MPSPEEHTSWRRWLRLERLLPLSTVLVATCFAVLGILQIIEVDVAHAMLVGLVTLLAVDALTERVRILARIEERLSNSSSEASIRPRKLLLSPPDQASNAREICIAAIHAYSAIKPHIGFYRERLEQGCYLKIMLLDSTSPSATIWDLLAKKEEGTTRREIESVLDSLRALCKAAKSPEQLHVKKVDFAVPCSIFGVNLNERTGQTITVEFHSYGVAIDERPHVRLTPEGSPKWFSYYRKQFHELFEVGTTLFKS